MVCQRKRPPPVLLLLFCVTAGAQKKDLKCFSMEGCSPFIAVLQQPWQRQFISDMAAKNQLDIVCLDATGQVNQYRWLLYAIVAADEFGEAVPLAYMITSSESHEPIVTFLEVVKGCSP